MKRLRPLVLLAALLIAGPALAADCTQIAAAQPTGMWFPLAGTNSNSAGAQAVAGDAGTHTSGCVDLTKAATLSVWKKCTSTAGTPHITVEWQESPDKETTNFVTVATPFDDATAETPEMEALVVPVAMYGRAIVHGETGNNADTECRVRLQVQGLPQ